MIVVGMKESAQTKWREQLPTPMQMWPARYKGLSTKMKNFPIFVVGNGHCSCDLLGRLSRRKSTIEDDLKRYRKKGWSDQKIKRAFENRTQSQEESETGLNRELRSWLADAVDETGEVFLFVHWDSDALKIEPEFQVSSETFREATFHVHEEQLIHIKKVVRYNSN